MRLLLRTIAPSAFLLAASLAFGAAAPEAAGPAAAPAPPVDYDRDIRPILAENCFACHGFDAGKRQAGLRLDIPEGAVQRLASGRAAVMPGKPEASELVRRAGAKNALVMPPASTGKTLKPAQLTLLRRWIAQGARYTRHWALTPPRRPSLPRVRNTKWPRNPIDAFVLAELEKRGLAPSPEADPRTLIRRVTLDLTGLPPTPEEVEAFVQECERSGFRVQGSGSERRGPRSRSGSGGFGPEPRTLNPEPYLRLVDRLLASPRFGERMAWEWLDAARYADTNGYQGDRTRTMWPWRDWVIEAFNGDLPFDRFTVEQLAGDLLPGTTVQQKIATGFNRNHMLNGEGGRIPEESRVDYVVDRVDTTSTVFMGLTIQCARCHDHKFDPFTQKEYYQIYAFFNNLPETGSVDRGGNANPVLSLPTPEQTARLAALDESIRGLEARVKAAPEAERAGIQKQLDEAKKTRTEVDRAVLTTMVMEERPQPRDTFVLLRGAYDKYGEKVGPGVPASLPALPRPEGTRLASRLALARWLVSPEHPLTARVTVNRFWQMLFGSGLVRTAEDFGVKGERPSHPALLDWLAGHFVRGIQVSRYSGIQVVGAAGSGPEYLNTRIPEYPSGKPWSVKALLRLIVTSSTYRQASAVTPRLVERDPENRLLARGPRFRLSAAQLRDQALAVSGLLVERRGGPPVKPYQPAGVWEDATFGQIKYEQDHGESLYRRSLYTFWRRIIGPTNLFDTASRQTCTVRQARTNTPLHALTLLNDVTYVEAARAFAQRVLTEGAAGPGARPEGTRAARVDRAFLRATARHPSAVERKVLLQALARLRAQYAADPEGAKKLLGTGESRRDEALDPVEHAAWTGLCGMLLNLDEVVTKE